MWKKYFFFGKIFALDIYDKSTIEIHFYHNLVFIKRGAIIK